MKRISNPSQHVRIMHSLQIECADEPRLCSTHAEAGSKASAPIEAWICDASFEMLLLEAVDEALSSLGAPSKQIIYSHLERISNIRKQDIPYRIDEFTNAIERIFGVGAKLLEIRIMKRIYEKIGPSFTYFPKQKDLVFTEYVKAARAKFDEGNSNARVEVNRPSSNTRTLSWKEQLLKLA